MSMLMETRDLGVAIAGRSIVSGLNLRLGAGECLAVLGKNGAGKSTLLATLAGLRPPAAGEVRLGGDPLPTLSPREAARRRGWLGQSLSDPFASSVLETVLTGRHPHLGRWAWDGAEDLRIARDALAAVGLADVAARQMQPLTGGERQRVGLATLLTQQPLLFFLDEPLAHLDLNHQMAVLELFTRAARECGAALVLVLHEPGLAWRYCQRSLLLHGDGEYDLGESAALLSADKLGQLYGYPLKAVEVDGQRWFVPD